MKVLVTGSEGFIGSKIMQILREDLSINLFGIDIKAGNSRDSVQMDVSDKRVFSKYLEENKPEKIIHTASIKQLEACESSKLKAFKVNTLSTEIIANYCSNENNNCDVCYISSDVIFDGKQGNYRVESEVNPINWYGKTKAFSEILLKNLPNKAIYRTALVIGLLDDTYITYLEEELDNNILLNQTLLPQYIYRKLQNNENVYLPDNVYSNPTPITMLQRAISKFIYNPVFGTFHVAGASQLSRFEFGFKLAESFDFNPKLVKKDFSKVSKIRPLDITLDIQDSYSRLSLELNDWTFDNYIKTLGLEL